MFENTIVEQILLGIGGLTVVGLTEMLKRWFKVDGLWGYVISFGVSAVTTAYYLVSTGGFGLIPLLGYTVFVFLTANGIYKVAAKVELKD